MCLKEMPFEQEYFSLNFSVSEFVFLDMGRQFNGRQTPYFSCKLGTGHECYRWYVNVHVFHVFIKGRPTYFWDACKIFAFLWINAFIRFSQYEHSVH